MRSLGLSAFAAASFAASFAASSAGARSRLPAGPLIVGYGTRCDGKSQFGDAKMLAEAVAGVNVIVWFATNLARDEASGRPVVQGGPNATCVALVARELRRRALPTAHMISIGGWDAPHPSTNFSGAEWWRAWKAWNDGAVARPELGFGGYDGIDWDLEGNDKPSSAWNSLSVACVRLVGEMSVAAKAGGYAVSLVPPQSYLDVETSRFSRSLALAYPEYHPEFAYHGANAYAVLLAAYNDWSRPTFDFVDVQLYETYSRACEAIDGRGRAPSAYLLGLVRALEAGWVVDFDDDAALGVRTQPVRVPASRLVLGFSRGWPKSVWVPPREVGKAFAMLGPAERPRGLMYWNMADDGEQPVNGSKRETCDFAARFNEILRVR